MSKAQIYAITPAVFGVLGFLILNTIIAPVFLTLYTGYTFWLALGMLMIVAASTGPTIYYSVTSYLRITELQNNIAELEESEVDRAH